MKEPKPITRTQLQRGIVGVAVRFGPVIERRAPPGDVMAAVDELLRHHSGTQQARSFTVNRKWLTNLDQPGAHDRYYLLRRSRSQIVGEHQYTLSGLVPNSECPNAVRIILPPLRLWTSADRPCQALSDIRTGEWAPDVFPVQPFSAYRIDAGAARLDPAH